MGSELRVLWVGFFQNIDEWRSLLGIQEQSSLRNAQLFTMKFLGTIPKWNGRAEIHFSIRSQSQCTKKTVLSRLLMLVGDRDIAG